MPATVEPGTTVVSISGSDTAIGWQDPLGNTLSFTEVAISAGIDFVRTAPPRPSPPAGQTGSVPQQGMLEIDPFDSRAVVFTQGMRGGAAVLDFDRDGFGDLFLVGVDSGPDRLYRNNGDGTFADVGTGAGIAAAHLGSGAAAADFDGDGWVDLYVTSHGPLEEPGPGHHLLYRNQGDGTFNEVAAAAGVATISGTAGDGFGAAFGDIDLDGDLDLFVSGWFTGTLGNRLLKNEGDGTYVDVTDEAGIVDDGIRGFSPCLADMDGDRYPEIMMAADFGTSRYFANEGDGTFRDRSAEAGANKTWAGMGIDVADFDGDGRLDWYVTAIFAPGEFMGSGDGNKLYLNRGGGTFEEVATQAGVADGGWGWGTVAVDLNNDGWVDIVETNGWRRPAHAKERTRVWMNRGDGTFINVMVPAGLDHDLIGLGLIHFDYDNDGDQDLAITTPDGDFRLYRNDLSGSAANWLRISLDTSGSPGLAPQGIGSRVTVTVGDREMHYWVVSCANYLTSSEMLAHFGLGANVVVDEVRVEWADGTVTVVDSIAANQTLTLSSG
jgi:hypothetical protein